MIWIGLGVGGVIAVLIAYSNRRQDTPELVCPHCHTRGMVTMARVQRKQGISGGKATGALLTGGVSMLGTGLSRKQWVQACHCGQCGMNWDVA